MAVPLAATAVNGAVGSIWNRRRLRSMTVRADGVHLVTAFWTSVGVLGGHPEAGARRLLWPENPHP